MKAIQLNVFEVLKRGSLGKLPTSIYRDREFAMTELWRKFREDGATFKKVRVYNNITKEWSSIYENTIPNDMNFDELLEYIKENLKDRVKDISLIKQQKGNNDIVLYKITFYNNSGSTLNPYGLCQIAYLIEGETAIKPIKKKLENPYEISPDNTVFMDLMWRFSRKDLFGRSDIINIPADGLLFGVDKVAIYNGPCVICFSNQNKLEQLGLYLKAKEGNIPFIQQGNATDISKAEAMYSKLDEYTKIDKIIIVNKALFLENLKKIGKQLKSKDYKKANVLSCMMEFYPNTINEKGKIIYTLLNTDYGHSLTFSQSCNYNGKAFIKGFNTNYLVDILESFKSEGKSLKIGINEDKGCLVLKEHCIYGDFKAIVAQVVYSPSKKGDTEPEKVYNGVYFPKKKAIDNFNLNYVPVDASQEKTALKLKYKYKALSQLQALELLNKTS